MASIVFVCLFALLSKTISGQYIGPYNAGPYSAMPETAALNGFGYGAPLANPMMYEQPIPNGMFPANGGTFTVRSSSPIPPSGVSVQSENLVIEGPVAVTGKLPFLGVVSLEGPLPTAGEGSIAYGCGNGNVGIVSENEVMPAHVNPAPMAVAPNLRGHY